MQMRSGGGGAERGEGGRGDKAGKGGRKGRGKEGFHKQGLLLTQEGPHWNFGHFFKFEDADSTTFLFLSTLAFLY